MVLLYWLSYVNFDNQAIIRKTFIDTVDQSKKGEIALVTRVPLKPDWHDKSFSTEDPHSKTKSKHTRTNTGIHNTNQLFIDSLFK